MGEKSERSFFGYTIAGEGCAIQGEVGVQYKGGEGSTFSMGASRGTLARETACSTEYSANVEVPMKW